MTIWLRGGDYVRTSALELTEVDSGTAEAPVVWRACAGETVRLLGGRPLGNFQPVRDARRARAAGRDCEEPCDAGQSARSRA